MIGATFFSGIGAPEVAAPWIDWRLAAEIETFPREVLTARHRYQDARHRADGPRLWGDVTALRVRHLRRLGVPLPDIIVAGSPCQAFSLAGLRRGTEDHRGNLTLQFLRTVHAIRHARGDGRLVLLWENVPGVLSDRGNAFGNFLAGLVGAVDALPPPGDGSWPGEGMVSGPWARVAWAILDAQHFGVAQRRRRVFAVVDFGGAVDPAAVLLEPDRLRGDRPARGGARKDIAPTLGARASSGGGLGTDFDLDGGLIPIAEAAVCGTLSDGAHNGGGLNGQDAYSGRIFPVVCATGTTTHALTAEGHDASEDGTWRGTPVVAFNARQDPDAWLDRTGPLDTDGATQAVALDAPLDVRRLTPREAERLQGFPDDFTLIPRGKRRPFPSLSALKDEARYLRATYPDMPLRQIMTLAADGPRYKALGNSMAVPVIAYILERIRQSAEAQEHTA